MCLAGIVASVSVGFMSVTSYATEDIVTSDKKEGIYTIAGDVNKTPELIGQSAIVVDMKTGYTLYEKNIYEKRYPASITKIMTALLTLEQAAMDEIVTFSYGAVFSVEAGSSVAYVDVDEQLSIEQCLYGLMLISGNDVANGLAEHVGGSMSNFANMMTERAAELGCVGTKFTNAHGLHDEEHYTCAYDMALIAMNTYEKQENFRKICSTLTYKCAPTNKQKETRVWGNNNRLINPYEKVYYEDCIGGKTGYTNQAGGTLVTYANINGRDLVCVIMKSTNSAGAFSDTTALYDYIKENVTASMYNDIDKKYEDSHKTEEAVTQNPNENNQSEDETEITTIADSKADADVKEAEDDGIWIGWKIILLVVTIFIVYYVYVRYMRIQNMKRIEQKRRQRLRERDRERNE